VLVTDASDVDVSAFLHQDVNFGLSPFAYHSRNLTPTERKYSTYEKVCLTVLFGCETYRFYLEDNEFLLHSCRLLLNVKDLGSLAKWILRVAPFKYKILRTRGRDNVIADAQSRMFGGV